MPKKLTLVWQSPNCPFRKWILEIFSPVIEREIFDGQHQVVLDDCILVDTQMHRVDPSYYAQFRGKNAFLLREPDEHFRDVSGVYVNFCGVFRMHYSAAFRRERVLPIPLGYGRGLERQMDPKPCSQRKYAWSMLGQINKSTRPDALTALLPIQPGYWYASDGWTPGANVSALNVARNQAPASYKEILAESAFCPAPMGNVQQETNRPFEALEVGSIPLLEKRWLMDVHRGLLGDHPLPTFSSWKKAAAFVESMWKDKQALDRLQAECDEWWQAYKTRLTSQVESHVDRLWHDVPSGNSEFVRWYARIPGWPMWELLRHHSVPALRRRVVRQSLRVVKQRRLFERL